MLVELLKMVKKKSNLLALFFKEIFVEGSVHVQLVEGVVDFGEFIANIRGVKAFGGLPWRALVLWGEKLKKSKSVEVRRKRQNDRRDRTKWMRGRPCGRW